MGKPAGGSYQVGDQSTIEKCIFTRKIANNGGGLSNLSSTMNVIGSLFSANTAVEQRGGSSVTNSTIPYTSVTNTTVTGDQALFSGGVALENSIIALLNNMTIVGNTASGIYNGATATMQNTIMAKNPTRSAPDCDT